MKILVIGDLHGRTIWKNIIEVEHPDKVIFLGDYFDSFEISTRGQLNNFEDLLKEQQKFGKDRFILLLGNHDYHYWATHCAYSGYRIGTRISVQPILTRAIEEDLITLSHVEGTYLFTHAGVSNYWMKEVAHIDSIEELSLKCINSYNLDWNTLKGNDPFGNTVSNSPIWIRPKALASDSIMGYTQVVGHTRVPTVTYTPLDMGAIILCDALPQSYLTIYDGKTFINQVRL